VLGSTTSVFGVFFFQQLEVVLGSTTSTLIFFFKKSSHIHFIMIYAFFLTTSCMERTIPYNCPIQ